LTNFTGVAFRKNIYRAIEGLQADLTACARDAQQWRPYSNRVQ